MYPIIIIIIILVFSFDLIWAGIRGYKEKKFNSNNFIRFFPLQLGLRMFTNINYEGKEANAPSITCIFFGSLGPLLFLSAFLESITEYAMPIVLGLIGIFVIFMIFYKTDSHN